MSCSTSIIYGYGFSIEDLTPNAALSFIQNHAKTIIKQFPAKQADILMSLHKKQLHDIKELDTFLENIQFENHCYGQRGIGGVICAIMIKETGIRFQYEPSQGETSEDTPTILLAETMPWNCNRKEKQLTQKKLHHIMTPYYNELQLTTNIDYLKIEYYE